MLNSKASDETQDRHLETHHQSSPAKNILLFAGRLVLMAFIIVVAYLLILNIVPAAFLKVPQESWKLTSSDVIVVLGTPSTKDGKVTPILRERILRAVELYNQGYARNILMSGGPAHSKFVEADVMADFAISKGVPRQSIASERKSRDTLENASESTKIMKERNWNSAIVVTSYEHVPRSNLIFARHHIRYCMAGCKDPPEQSLWSRINFDQREKLKTLEMMLTNNGN